jgi:hypothetical protein
MTQLCKHCNCGPYATETPAEIQLCGVDLCRHHFDQWCRDIDNFHDPEGIWDLLAETSRRYYPLIVPSRPNYATQP